MIYLNLFFAVMLLAGCDQSPTVRHYTEEIIEAPRTMPPMMALGNEDPHAGLDMSGAPSMPANVNDGLKDRLTWKIPVNWIQEPGKGMRLASFHLKDNPKDIDVSIVSLGGMAGGLEANLKRWLGQIQLEVSDEELQQFIQSSRDNIFDFTQLQKGADVSSKSTIAGMVTVDNATVFVKMSGTIAAVIKHKADFVSFAKSVHAK